MTGQSEFSYSSKVEVVKQDYGHTEIPLAKNLIQLRRIEHVVFEVRRVEGNQCGSDGVVFGDEEMTRAAEWYVHHYLAAMATRMQCHMITSVFYSSKQ